MVSEPYEFESSPEMAPETGALVPGAGKLAKEEQKAGGSSVVFQQVVRDSGGSWLMLTRSNYADWALLMQVMLEARQVWVAVNDGTPERETDRAVMEYLQIGRAHV